MIDNPFAVLERRLNRLEALLVDIKEATIQANQAQPTTATERPLNIDEAAAFLNLAKPTIYQLVSQREIPVKKKGNRLYFFKDELTEWINSGRKKTNQELQQEATTYRKRRA